MVEFKAVIKKFGIKGEKTGWTYIDIPAPLAEKLNPGCKKSFRVKGFLDKLAIKQQAILPMGEGDFILVLNAGHRKSLRKIQGASLSLALQHDPSEIKLSGDFTECLQDEPQAMNFFESLSKSQQQYFSKWIESAKTEVTKTKRIVMAIRALAQGMDFGEMLRAAKKKED